MSRYKSRCRCPYKSGYMSAHSTEMISTELVEESMTESVSVYVCTLLLREAIVDGESVAVYVCVLLFGWRVLFFLDLSNVSDSCGMRRQILVLGEGGPKGQKSKSVGLFTHQ